MKDESRAVMTVADRRALIAHVEAALQLPRGSRPHLLLVRLRKLGSIEAHAGEPAASALRAALRQRLREIGGEGSFVAEAGAEAVALVRHVDGHAEGFAQGVLGVVAMPLEGDAGTLLPSANAGICAIDPANGDATTHVERTMRALERAMALGPDCVEVVSDSGSARAAAAWDMRVALEEAAHRGELAVEYQPIRTLASGQVEKVEALLRWASPRFGRVAPDRFVPILEESGLIVPVGEWVLQQACRQAAQWRRAGLATRVSVNISRVQLHRQLDAAARRVLERTGCQARWIELEITETALVQEWERIHPCIEALVAMGFTIAIDDFGSGYSSLGQLAQLPVHHLKLDRTLIDGLPASGKQARIVKAVVALAEGLGMELTSEGVELPEQSAWLARFPRMHGQGYFYGRPMPAGALDAVLRLAPAGN